MDSTADQTLDPVLSPAAYQAYLLAALGADDPAVAQAATPAKLRAIVAGAGDLVRVLPEPGEWSVLQCLAHIVDGELVSASPWRPLLEEAGFVAGYRGHVLRRATRRVVVAARGLSRDAALLDDYWRRGRSGAAAGGGPDGPDRGHRQTRR